MSDKILIISPSWIGDCVMSQPLLQRLHELRAGCTIDVFAPKWSQAVYERMPEVAQIWDNPFGHGALRLRERWRVGRDLQRQHHYQQVIVLPGSLKSAIVAMATGAPRRTGYVGESRYLLLNDVRKLDKTALPLMVDRYTALAHDTQTALTPASPAPRLQVQAANQAETLVKYGLSRDKRIIAFCPGAEYGAAKRWLPAHFATTARHYAAQDYQIWLFGSAKDADVAAQIQQLSGDICVDLCGKTSLAEAIDLLACADTVVCNDSGLMHIAAAVGCNVVAVYGSSSAQHTPPLSDKARIATLNLNCSPCFKRECPLGHTDCLVKLSPERVMVLVDELHNKNK